MTLLREALDVGAFPSSATVRHAFEILEDELLQPGDLPPDLRDEYTQTIDEIRDAIKTNAGCKRFRDLLYDMGLFGSARSRRVKAVAAQLGIPYEDIVECLRKSREELEHEEDAELELELEAPEEPPCPPGGDLPVDLVTWVCLPPERIPEDDECAQPEPLLGAEDTRTFDPFPTVPDVDDALQLCRFAENNLTIAKSTGEILSTSTLTGFLRMFHALAYRPNPPPAILYKRCLETATEILTDYWASDVPGGIPPPAQDTIDDINRELDDYFPDQIVELQDDVLDIELMLREAEELGLTDREAHIWLTILEEAINTAAALDDFNTVEQLEQLREDIDNIHKTIPVDPDRPPPPGIYRSVLPDNQQRQEREDAARAYGRYLTERQLRGIRLTPAEQDELTAITKALNE